MSDAPCWECLGGRLQEIIDAARSAWPEVEMPASVFADYLARRLPKGQPVERSLSGMDTSDLYLACACVKRVPGALESFERELLNQVPAFLARVDASPAFVDEVRQRLREKFFVSRADMPPRISEYSGRGSLRNWVRVTAVRTALDLKTERRHEPLDGRADVDAGLPVDGTCLEQQYLKARYQKAFEEAVEEALRDLPEDLRNVLRLRFLQGLSIDDIGRLLHVHRTTAARWAASARDEILAGTRRRLSQRLGLRPGEIDSLVALLQSQLHVSIIRLLQTGPLKPDADLSD